MFAALLAVLALHQDLDPVPPTPYDRVVELEITADDEPAIEGHGGTVFAEYEVQFDGTLHVWAMSELDLFLQVDDAAEARRLASDDNSGGGTTPYLSLNVERGAWLAILVSGVPGSTGSLSLHLAAAPETEATLAAATAAHGALQEARRLARRGQQRAASELLGAVLAEIEDTAGAASSQALADARASIAVPMSQMGDLAGGRRLMEFVLAAFERTLPEDHADLLRARANLANSMDEMGDLAGARALRESVLAAFERTLPEDHPDILRARANVSNSMGRMGDPAGARALDESVLAARERILPENHPDVLTARANLASSMFEVGDLAGARALLESVVAAFERTLPEDHSNILLVRSNLAILTGRMGDLAGARALRESVLAAYERSLPADHPDLVITRASLANSLFEMGEFAGARALRESVLATLERTVPDEHPELLRARLNLANSLGYVGEFGGARALRESVLEVFERTLPEHHPKILHARVNLSSSMYDMGDLAGARALDESVLAARERALPEDHPDLLTARANLAASMHETGDFADAREHLAKLVAGMRARVLASLALAPRQARQTVASESFRHSEVLFLSASAGSELERGAFELTETMRLVAAEAGRSLGRFDTDPELAPIIEEASDVRRALNDLVAGAAQKDAAADEVSARLTTLSLRRDRLERQASQILARRGVVTQPVDAAVLSAALSAGEAAVGFRRMARWGLNKAGSRAEVGADYLLAHVLTPDGELTRIDLGPALELEQLAIAWRNELGAPLLGGGSLSRGISHSDGISLGEGDDDNPEWKAGDRLRARILAPVLALLGDDVERLIVCADDLLFLLPLDALPDSGNEKGRIGDRLRIVNEVSFARLLAPSSPVESAPSLLTLGGVDYDVEGAGPGGLGASSAPIETRGQDAEPENAAGGPDHADPNGAGTTRSALPLGFRYLGEAGFEAEATADIFGEAFDIESTLLSRKDATKAALFDAAPGKRYVHLATHGWFAPESVRSTEDARPGGSGFARMGIEERVSGLAPMTLCGLALVGANNGRDSLGRVPGILTAEELCSLDLSQCELAVLSACETNVGIRRAGQGIQSLQSALYAAGARTSITSLWKVDDAATRRLMEVFYDNLWLEGMGKSEALWQAKQTLRDEGDPPAHWAGWVLTGDPE